jgi:hypothetical protein
VGLAQCRFELAAEVAIIFYYQYAHGPAILPLSAAAANHRTGPRIDAEDNSPAGGPQNPHTIEHAVALSEKRGIEKCAWAVVPHAPDDAVQRKDLATPNGVPRPVLLGPLSLAVLFALKLVAAPGWGRLQRDPVIVLTSNPAPVELVTSVASEFLDQLIARLHGSQLERHDEGFRRDRGRRPRQETEHQAAENQYG